MSQLFVFPDTNIFLHYLSLDQIDWTGLLGADAVVLLLAPVVIRELNKHKDFPTSTKTRDRAASALKKLHEWVEQPSPVMIRDSVELRFRITEPMIDFAAEHLSRELSDDHLVASMLEFRKEHPECELALVSHDLGLKLKSKTYSIRIFQLPGSLRLPEELDAKEKRITELEQENKRLRERIPALTLRFANGIERLNVSLQPPEPLTPEEISRRMDDIRKKYPKIDVLPTGNFLGLEVFSVSPDEVKEYNIALETFYAEYQAYLPTLQDFHNLQRRTQEIRIVLANGGTCPAEDIDIFLHFPDGFEIFAKEGLPEPPHGPKPPSRPQTPQERLADAIRMPRLYMPDFANRVPTIPQASNVGRPSIRRTKSYEVKVPVKKIKHGFVQSLDLLYLVFESFDSAHSFRIDYTIHAANLPDPIGGKLHVVIDHNLGKQT